MTLTDEPSSPPPPLLSCRRRSCAQTPSPAASPAALDPALDPATFDGHFLGDENAKVTLTLFSDYLCPHCRTYHKEIEPSVMADYVDTGKVRLRLIDYPVIGARDKDLTDDSITSVQIMEAANCAAEQDQYEAYRERMFVDTTDDDAFSDEWLIAQAADLGLDEAQFRAALESGKYEQTVIASAKIAKDAHSQGTPSFQIDGGEVFFLGQSGYDGLEAKLDDALGA